jgi:high-affinity Fe2+/Pb2+ permease
VAGMMIGLSPFFFLIKSKKYLHFNREEQKNKFLEKLTRKESSTFSYFIFVVITNFRYAGVHCYILFRSE